ncbi:MAG: hypothetical protein AB2L14_09200 [Candidatus Xenobiia bacterium LiM19]
MKKMNVLILMARSRKRMTVERARSTAFTKEDEPATRNGSDAPHTKQQGRLSSTISSLRGRRNTANEAAAATRRTSSTASTLEVERTFQDYLFDIHVSAVVDGPLYFKGIQVYRLALFSALGRCSLNVMKR